MHDSLPGSIRCLLDVPSYALFSTAEGCAPMDSNGNIAFNHELINGGTPPFQYDWDNLNTPGNDIYYDDGEVGIDSLTAGWYAMIVTDASGCVDSAFVEVELLAFDVSVLIDSVGLCNQTGGIQIVSLNGPPWFVNYNWDFAFTPEDDDYGTGPSDLGFPEEENDMEDLNDGLEGGIYFLTITFVDDTLSPLSTCVLNDTINISIDSSRIICPSGDTYLFAGSFDNTISYQWQIDSLNGYVNVINDAHHDGTTSPVLHLIEMPSSRYGHQYRCRLIQGPNTSYSDPFTLKFGVCWNGTSSSWHNPSAWTCNYIPDTNTDVYIGSNSNPYPNIGFNAICRSMKLYSGASVTIFPPISLTVTGGQP